ncbi:hypothetical protein ACA910_003922 [Epithemia clementina (nom. ined.)]
MKQKRRSNRLKLLLHLLPLATPFWQTHLVLGQHTFDTESAAIPSEFGNLRSSVEAALNDFENLQRDLDFLSQGEAKLAETLENLQQQHLELSVLTRNVDEIVRQKVNVKAVRHLKGVLSNIHELELKARDDTESMTHCGQPEEVLFDQTDEVIDVLGSEAELNEILASEDILGAHDAHMEEWCRKIIQEEIENLPVPTVDLLTATGDDSVVENNDDDGEACASPAEATQIVQTALAESFILTSQEKLYDHAANGAWIVHELTSETFQPGSSELGGRQSNSPAWMDFIPEDWIDLMGHLNAKYRSDLRQVPNRVSYLVSTMSLSKAAVNPPETVLHPLVLPGSCWPLQGEKGFLTLALPYAVSLSALSLDHVSPRLLLKGDFSSAPKKVNVVGYPPCSSRSCNGFTFDPKKPFQVLEFEYDVDSGPTQTVDVEYREAKNDGEISDLPGGSCLAPNANDDAITVTSCSATPSSIMSIRPEDRVTALRFEFLENHGHADFTCIYRLRVHGQPAA